MMNSKRLFTIFFLLAAFEAAISVIWLGLIPAEARNALLFGYSAQRLLLMAGMVITAVGFFKIHNSLRNVNFEKIITGKWVSMLFITVFLAGWIAFFLPSYQWGGWAGYKDRILPIIWWVLMFAGQSLILMSFFKKKTTSRSWKEVLRPDQGILKAWGYFSAVIALCVLVVTFFRIGLVPDIVYWNDTNVPLLSLQVIGIITGSIILILVLGNLGFFPKIWPINLQNRTVLPEFILCLLIWGLAVVVWTQVEMPHSYFSPGPYPPNGEMYPFSDAAGYDTTSQLAAIGEGLGTQFYVDKPLYVAFLTLIHLLAGGRMETVTGLQVAVIALLPVAIYILGMKIHSRLAGLLAAGFVIFREVNNIQGTLWVLSTNSRILMSESLVTLLLALFILFLAGWIHSREKSGYLMASGGFLGLAALVRLNPFLLLPVALLAIILVSWKRWKQALSSSLLFAMFFLAAILPWTIQSWIVHDNILFFRSTINGVVLGQRTFYSLNQPVPQAGTQDEIESTSPVPQQPVNRTWNRITGVSRYVSAHFFHNLISSAAIFPTSFRLDSLENVIKTPPSFWSADWSGDLSPGQIIFLLLNLAVIALGVAAGWSRRRQAGLVPAGFLVAYSLATAAARTSGGRYILPADWVVMFYFAIGIAQVYYWGVGWPGDGKFESVPGQHDNEIKRTFSVWKISSLVMFFVLIGGIPVILDRLIPQRYERVDKTTLVTELDNRGLITLLGTTKAELGTFLQLPDAVAYNGRGLYPRFYAMNQGEPDQFSAARGQPFPRLVMSIIGPHKIADGVLPLSKSPDVLPNGADVLAIGCKGELNDDWLALIVNTPEPAVYMRNPVAEWNCPVPLPVCDGNRNCR